jgi:DNA-binding transcriptional regulator LsrR (DeoR family)
MRKFKEVFRFKYDYGISERAIARSCRVSRSTVADYLMKAKAYRIGLARSSIAHLSPAK